MNIPDLFDHASRIMTVLSAATFTGILAWAYVVKNERDFAASAALPFADDAVEEDHV